LINLDYIKGTEAFNNSKVMEYQAVGNYVNSLKSLISNEIKASIFTSVQNNRLGITQGKKASDIVDNEASFSLSDRIIQMSSHGFVMRFKTVEELATEKHAFGNLRLTPVKMRRVVGRRGGDILRPVKLANGQFAQQYLNLNVSGFHLVDKGLLSDMLIQLGEIDTTGHHKPAAVSDSPI
jgi:hypothetical protein